MIRRRPVRQFRGMGWPILPDSFHSASGGFQSFSPNTPDATVMQFLNAQGQALPPDLAAQWAAAQAGGGSGNTAVNPSGQPVSTQTGAGIRVLNTTVVAPGVWRWDMSDGSSYYADSIGNPINYSPAAPSITPAGGSTAVVPVASQVPIPQPMPMVPSMPPPLFLGPPQQAPGSTPTAPAPPVAVTPGGTPISTVTTAPAPVAAPQAAGFDLSGITAWLQGSLISGVPNWMLVAGGVVGVIMLSSGGSSGRKR